MIVEQIPQIKILSPAQKLQLAAELWDELLEHGEELPEPDWVVKELERRLEQYRQNPETGKPWPEVRDSIRRTRRA